MFYFLCISDLSTGIKFILYLKANIFGTTRKSWLALMGDWPDNESGCKTVCDCKYCDESTLAPNSAGFGFNPPSICANALKQQTCKYALKLQICKILLFCGFYTLQWTVCDFVCTTNVTGTNVRKDHVKIYQVIYLIVNIWYLIYIIQLTFMKENNLELANKPLVALRYSSNNGFNNLLRQLF